MSNEHCPPLPLERAAKLMFEIAMLARSSDRRWDEISQDERDKWITLIALWRNEKKPKPLKSSQMTVNDLRWHPHPERPDLGDHAVMDLGDEWEATFLRGEFSARMAPRHPEVIEMAIWRPDGDQEGENHYGTLTELQTIIDSLERKRHVRVYQENKGG